MNKKKLKKIVLKVFEFTIYLGVGYFIYKKLGGSLKGFDLSKFNFWLFSISILIFSIHTIFSAFIWNFMIKSLGNKTSLMEQMDVYLRSYILRYIPGNIVGIMARGLYNVRFKIPLAQSLWAWFLENITYLAVAVLIGSLAILSGAISSTVTLIIMVIVVIVGILMLTKTDLLEDLFNRFVVKAVSKKHKEIEEIHLIMSNKAKLLVLLYYFIAWMIYSLSFIILVKAVGVDISQNILLLVSINALSYAVGYISLITPSGAGIREGVMVASLTGLAGFTPENALIVALGARVVFILGELSGYVFFYLYKILTKNNGKKV